MMYDWDVKGKGGIKDAQKQMSGGAKQATSSLYKSLISLWLKIEFAKKTKTHSNSKMKQ